MPATVRRIQGYSAEPAELAAQVAELARDVRDSRRVEVAGPFVHSGSLRLPFGLDVGGRKPLLLVATYTDKAVEHATLPQWQWHNGQVQIQSLSAAPSAGDKVTLTFFALREVV